LLSGFAKLNISNTLIFIKKPSWADVFSRKVYRDIISDSFKYCWRSKGL